ncbi:MAG: hypothetical protein R3E12_18300 [Candidatus Eisenbacteria bacterium]
MFLVGAVTLISLTTGGCGVLDSGDKPVVPADHTESLDGVLHAPLADDPYLGGGNCTDYRCHHADLAGGWSELDRHGSRLETSAPSCFQCHGTVWSERYPETIRVLYPIPNEVWEHGSSRFVEWWAPPALSHTIELVRADTLVGEISTTDAPGVVRIATVPAGWGTGDGFRIRVRDDEGRSGFSPHFSICAPGAGVSVHKPIPGATFTHGQTIDAAWSCAAGVSVDILVYRGDDPVDTFKESAANTGFATREIPERWTSGTEYRLMVRDREGRTGFSGEFEIR